MGSYIPYLLERQRRAPAFLEGLRRMGAGAA